MSSTARRGQRSIRRSTPRSSGREGVMLTAEENTLLTQVGPGSSCGELLRRYWHPVAKVQELSEESPTKFVRILGEDLVLFKDKRGGMGLLADHCSHRGASLL